MTQMMYDNAPRALSAREAGAIDDQAIKTSYPDDWNPSVSHGSQIITDAQVGATATITYTITYRVA